MDLDKIAVVDYNDYATGDATTRQNFIKEFGDSFSNMGFAIVRNHGVTTELRNKLLEVSKSDIKSFKMPSTNSNIFLLAQKIYAQRFN